MGWARNVIEDPLLAPYFEWDGQCLEKFNGEKWVHFVHESWTGKHTWNVQSVLQSLIHCEDNDNM
jgi:hypothetical protein